MRIWHQSLACLEDLPAYGSALRRRVALCVGAQTVVEVHGLDRQVYAGLPPAEVLRFPFLRHLVHRQVFAGCLAAEAQHFDAIALAGYSEPFLTECRSLVSIPVASMPESTLLLGCSMAEQIALVTLTRSNVRRVEAVIRKQRFESRVVGTYCLEPAVTEQDLHEAFADPRKVLENFDRIARRAIEDGADVIIPAEGVLNEVLALHGPRRIADVSVMDGLAVVLGYAELLVTLKSRTALEVGRRWGHARPGRDLLSAIQQTAHVHRDASTE